TGQITLVQGWDWYAGGDTGAIGVGQYDFQTVVTHELGHALGLGHSTSANSVMFASLDPAQARRELTVTDLAVPNLQQQVYAHPLLARPYVLEHGEEGHEIVLPGPVPVSPVQGLLQEHLPWGAALTAASSGDAATASAVGLLGFDGVTGRELVFGGRDHERTS